MFVQQLTIPRTFSEPPFQHLLINKFLQNGVTFKKAHPLIKQFEWFHLLCYHFAKNHTTGNFRNKLWFFFSPYCWIFCSMTLKNLVIVWGISEQIVEWIFNELIFLDASWKFSLGRKGKTIFTFNLLTW